MERGLSFAIQYIQLTLCTVLGTSLGWQTLKLQCNLKLIWNGLDLSKFKVNKFSSLERYFYLLITIRKDAL